MPGGGDREAFLTADYNAEMIEHIDRYPRVRDRAIFVGDPDTSSRTPSAPGCRRSATGPSSTTTSPATSPDSTRASSSDRQALGYRADERVCIVTVGGSGVGGHLLRRVIAAFPEAKQRVPDLRMIVVTGPRIDPGSLPAHDGLEVRPYVHELYRHLAVCDLAVVQGGLTTAMELTASRRPFLYFPLRHHFEQNLHVRHRLDRYRPGGAWTTNRGTGRHRRGDRQRDRPRGRLPPCPTDGAARAAARSPASFSNRRPGPEVVPQLGRCPGRGTPHMAQKRWQ